MPTIKQAKSWYPDADPVHGFDHVLRVYHLAERLAILEGADLEIVHAAVLLHDAEGPSTTGEHAERNVHHYSAADFARRILQDEGWPEERIAAVEHCIRAHRFRDNRDQPETLEAQILFDADKLDAIGAIGVARAIAYAARDGQPAFSQPSDHFLKSGEKEPGEGHSSYHEFIFKLQTLKDRMYTPGGRALAEERNRFMSEFYQRLQAELQGDQ